MSWPGACANVSFHGRNGNKSDGSTAAAYDDIVSIANGLVFITGVATDADGDKVYAVSDAGLSINFQDDGPHAFNDSASQATENASFTINAFANDYHDLGTSDYITGLMEEHEKMAWMLRSYFIL